MDFEILKAAMLASKSTMLKGDDVTTEKMPGKMSPGGGNNAKANDPGGGGTPLYGLYRYVPRNRVWFLEVLDP